MSTGRSLFQKLIHASFENLLFALLCQDRYSQLFRNLGRSGREAVETADYETAVNLDRIGIIKLVRDKSAIRCS